MDSPVQGIYIRAVAQLVGGTVVNPRVAISGHAELKPGDVQSLIQALRESVDQVRQVAKQLSKAVSWPVEGE